MQKLHPKVIWLFFIRRLIILSIVPIFAALYVIPDVSQREDAAIPYAILSASIIINVIIVLWFVLAYAWARFAYEYYGYELSDSAFQKTFGVFSKRTTTIPYETVKHVDTKQGIVGTLFGLVEVHIETWGRSHRRAENYLPGLTKETADRLTVELLKKAQVAQARHR